MQPTHQYYILPFTILVWPRLLYFLGNGIQWLVDCQHWNLPRINVLSSFHDNVHSMFYHGQRMCIMASSQRLQVDGKGNIEDVQSKLTTRCCHLCQVELINPSESGSLCFIRLQFCSLGDSHSYCPTRSWFVRGKCCWWNLSVL